MSEPLKTVLPVAVASIIKVALVEDQRKFRECLAVLIDGTAGFRCTGSFRTMETALDQIGHDLPDVVLVDVGLPGMSGIEGIRLLKERYPQLTLLMHTVYDDDERIFAALCAGASGYLLKRTPPEKIIDAIREAHTGGAPMTPSVAKQVLKLFSQPFQKSADLQTLTAREHDVLALLVRGYSYKMAAGEMNVSIETLRYHVKNIYAKLHVNSKSEAVVKAIQNKIG